MFIPFPRFFIEANLVSGFHLGAYVDDGWQSRHSRVYHLALGPFWLYLVAVAKSEPTGARKGFRISNRRIEVYRGRYSWDGSTDASLVETWQMFARRADRRRRDESTWIAVAEKPGFTFEAGGALYDARCYEVTSRLEGACKTGAFYQVQKSGEEGSRPLGYIDPRWTGQGNLDTSYLVDFVQRFAALDDAFATMAEHDLAHTLVKEL